MRRVAVAAVLPLLAVVLAGASGCVSAAKYRDLENSARNMQTRLEQAETELQGERAKARELAARLAAAQAELEAKNKEIQALMDARDRLKAAYEALRAEFDKLSKNPPMADITITRNPLPQKLSNALEEFAKKYPEGVEYDAARGLLKWKSDLLFDLGSDVIKQDALPALADFANILKSDAADGFDILIAGHTDNTRIAKPQTLAQHKSNWHLSAHRAISVQNELERDGVSADRQAVMGYGPYQPVASNDTTEHKAQNRRVEIYLVKKGNVPGSAQTPEVAETAAPEEPAEVAN